MDNYAEQYGRAEVLGLYRYARRRGVPPRTAMEQLAHMYADEIARRTSHGKDIPVTLLQLWRAADHYRGQMLTMEWAYRRGCVSPDRQAYTLSLAMTDVFARAHAAVV